MRKPPSSFFLQVIQINNHFFHHIAVKFIPHIAQQEARGGCIIMSYHAYQLPMLTRLPLPFIGYAEKFCAQPQYMCKYHVRMPAGVFCVTIQFNIQIKTVQKLYVCTSHYCYIPYSLICMVVRVERSQLFRHQPVLFISLLFLPQLTWYQMYVYRHIYQNKKEINLYAIY